MEINLFRDDHCKEVDAYKVKQYPHLIIYKGQIGTGYGAICWSLHDTSQPLKGCIQSFCTLKEFKSWLQTDEAKTLVNKEIN